MSKDYYKILGITKDSTTKEISKAYRKLALKWHPDRHKDSEKKNAEEKFKEISEAYEVLSDDEKRNQYDNFGNSIKTNFQNFNFVDANDIFSSIFSNFNNFTNESTRGNNSKTFNHFNFFTGGNPRTTSFNIPVIINFTCSLEELYTGCKKTFNIKKSNGQEKITIDVKPGYKEGTKITYHNVTPKDIVFVLKEKKHSYFERDGDNLIYNSEINLKQALKGIKINVPLLNGNVQNLKIENVIYPNYEHIVKNKGMPISKNPGKFGDLIIRFKILFPLFIPNNKKHILKELFDDNTNWK